VSGATVRPLGVPYRTDSERYFGIYLNRCRLPFEYERPVGSKRPDFFVEHPSAGPIVVEVHEFTPPPSPPEAGAVDPYEHIRRAIEQKRAQGRGAKGKSPYVLALYSHGWPILDVRTVTGAMFGNIAVRMPFSSVSGTSDGDAKPIYGHNGKMMHTRPEQATVQNTRFSAVAIIVMFNPTKVRLDRGYASIPDGLNPVKHLSRRIEVRDEYVRTGLYRPDFDIPRLIVCHNPDAAVPLPLDAFGGPHDEQWAIASDDRRLHLAATGLGYHEVPNNGSDRG
jgi:hypothetical protein